jgi:glycosyltransferase involved in cell wall biosynthesis
MPARLTIAIPTYNRAAKLQAQLDRLVPQLTPEVRCCIYDNASTDETQQVVEKYVSQGISYHRSPYNVGAALNFFRCFQECQTEWLWILSDDDPISSHAVANLLAILHNSAYDFIHTSSLHGRHDVDVAVSEIGQLLKHAKMVSLLWISPGIYKISSFRPLLGLFVESISTCGPQFVVILALLERQKGKVLLSHVNLLSDEAGEPGWSNLHFIVRFCQLPESIFQAASQKATANAIFMEFYQIAMMRGLAETNNPEQIRKWQRIRKIVPQVLKSYHASAPWTYALKNWFRAGERKKSLLIVHTGILLVVLGWCPVALFDTLLKILPLPEMAARCLQNRKKHSVSE